MQTASLQRVSQLRGIRRLSFSQLCLCLLIIAVSVFEGDLSGFVYLFRKSPSLGVNDASWCFSNWFHHQALLTCHSPGLC